ncbi:MAG: hypothetical protein NC420_00700 [Eubacterium sp.]|nr:hypothetical protein [Eubacterium sp.]MCM1213779.1 hypothetical protein [Lachnospiraceae bacterium]MCM1303343.1 hypothetical protein [Butyrivibrio sp.]MCM1342967.1 hypothetical protein [Muribaculaceae bacterium]MCM1237898.1 hypothetical protein [Lachnospiraceae bacterium]
MLNEERIILMTQLAAYEEREGKKNIKIDHFFRSDYIAVQVLKSIVSSTIAFALVFAVYIFYDFENFMQDLYKMDLIAFARDVLIRYGVTVVAYGVITYVACTYRYARVKRSLKRYYHNLKKLNSMYRE